MDFREIIIRAFGLSSGKFFNVVPIRLGSELGSLGLRWYGGEGYVGILLRFRFGSGNTVLVMTPNFGGNPTLSSQSFKASATRQVYDQWGPNPHQPYVMRRFVPHTFPVLYQTLLISRWTGQ